MKPGKWHKRLFLLAAAAVVLSGLYAFWPARRDDLDSWEHKVKLPPASDMPGAESAVPAPDLATYWQDGRMVWVQPVTRGPVRVELPLPWPTLALPPMPLPDPSPLLEHSAGLPRWGEVPKASPGGIE